MSKIKRKVSLQINSRVNSTNTPVFTTKYANSDPGYVVRSLTYFADVESQIDPITLNAKTWPEAKQRVLQAVKELV